MRWHVSNLIDVRIEEEINAKKLGFIPILTHALISCDIDTNQLSSPALPYTELDTPSGQMAEGGLLLGALHPRGAD